MNTIIRISKTIVLTGTILYLLLGCALFFFQDHILFLGGKTHAQYYSNILQDPHIQHRNLQTPDGYQLDGWEQKQHAPNTILYFGGNGDDITEFIKKISIPNTKIIAFNYRGYGESTGKPSEASLFADSLLIYDSLVKSKDIYPASTYVMGRSLGSGIATYLASQRSISGVILITPYDSIESIGKERFPYFPISLMLENKFIITPYCEQKENRALFIIAGEDQVISYPHTEKLIQAWRGPYETWIIDHADHNSVMGATGIWDRVSRFIDRDTYGK